MGVESFRNIFAIPDLRKRVLFMFGLLAVYRIGCIIPTPGIDPQALLEFMDQMQGTVLGFVNTFTGGSLGRVAIFALGIMPYISASIILQLLTVVWPYAREALEGRRAGPAEDHPVHPVRNGDHLDHCRARASPSSVENLTSPGGAPLVFNPGLGFKFMTVLSLTTGCAFVMWLGEQISERGIGNGISLIIFAGIVVGLPGAVLNTLFSQDVHSGAMSLLKILLPVGLHARGGRLHRLHGAGAAAHSGAVREARSSAGASTVVRAPTCRLRVNTGGVIPVIFASSMVTVPATVAGMIKYEPIQTDR